MGFADDFIDVMAIDALKRTNLESDPRGLNVRQGSLDPSIGGRYGAELLCGLGRTRLLRMT